MGKDGGGSVRGCEVRRGHGGRAGQQYFEST